MMKKLALALPLLFAPLPAAASDDIYLSAEQDDNLRCAIVFAAAVGFHDAGLSGFEAYDDLDARGERFFVSTMEDIVTTNGVENEAVVPLIEERVASVIEDPDAVASQLPECLYVLEDFDGGAM